MKQTRKALFILALGLLLTACSKQTDAPNVDISTSISASEQEVVESTDASTEQELEQPVFKAPVKIEVSGNKEDVIVTESDCYIEGESVIIYLQKGLTVPGDIVVITEKIMQDLCDVSGLNFDPNYYPPYPMECRDLYYEPGLFAEINKDAAKINILVVDLEDGYVEWACDHNAILDIADYDYEYSLYQTIYHELAHVLHHRNGVGLSPTLNEGYATYLSSKTLRTNQMADWNTIQHYFPADFDESLIAGGEETFTVDLSDREDPYNYGFRLLTFLSETYGDDIFAKILAEATAQGYDSGYDPNNKEASIDADTLQMISIIKSQTSEDVFEQFATWYTDNWSTKADEYMSYISAFEQ